ncbi:hypothetical protein Back2_07560 [Nocardioides baekrokdamisoli]|uniref:Class F sortase n=1 Tax=Nocardioides baekrokdamisoli TaxID=1804624 RepID=A0A3G9J0H5_9ACTN|nr:class F sortase [Nocardioides baekrokdamisoli]BBH16469.1 hypothetical protein Back2_07560 [Nocardioides baekrokdamisoli]
MAATATVAVAATVLASRARDAREEVLEAPDEPVQEPSVAPEPIIRSTERRRTEPIPGRRARRPHIPKRRRDRQPGMVAAVLMLVVGVVLAVPWYLPGFGGYVHDVGMGLHHLFIPAGPAVVRDPAVLTTEPADSTPPAPDRTPGVPVSLQVPLLQVDSTVVPISGDSGELLPPDDPQMIGWWKQGPRPGSSEGAAVLTGHTVHFGGGAFDHLSYLKVGNHFTIRTTRGSIRYVVVRLHKYGTGELSRDATSLFQLTGPPRVLLVTCSGWNGHIYLENTVVTGVPA